MDQAAPAPRPLASERSPWLRGRLAIPADPLLSHYALVLGGMARGESIIEGLRQSDDVLATAAALQALGVQLFARDGRWHVAGIGTGGFLEPDGPLQFSAPTGLILALGMLAYYPFESRFAGAAVASGSGMASVLEPLRALGATAVLGGDDDPALTLRGPRMAMPLALRLEREAGLVRDALMLAGLTAPGTSSITSPPGTPDCLERMVAAFGGRVQAFDSETDRRVAVEGLPYLLAQRVGIAADPGLAALGIAAASVVPGSEIGMDGVLANPTRTVFLETARAMGADVTMSNRRTSAGQEIADMVVRSADLAAVAVPGERAALLGAELLPALAVLAAYASGTTVIAVPPEAMEMSGRLTIALRSNGVAAELADDGLRISGGRVRGGGRVETRGDPNLAMAMLVLGMGADDGVIIDDQSAIASQFPEFRRHFEDVGASFIRYTD